MVIITGKDLTIEEVVQVARYSDTVALAEEAQHAIQKARAYVEEKLAKGEVIYGLTTGFGEFQRYLFLLKTLEPYNIILLFLIPVEWETPCPSK